MLVCFIPVENPSIHFSPFLWIILSVAWNAGVNEVNIDADWE